MKIEWYRILKIFIFVMCFQVDVRVRAAEEPKLSDYTQAPNACWSSEDTCAIESFKISHLKSEAVQVHLDKSSIFVRKGPQEYDFVSGVMWISAEKDVKIQTDIGIFSGHGDFWFIKSKKDDALVVRVQSGKMNFTAKNSETAQIPSGFENWYRGFDPHGQLTQGILKVIDVPDHLKMWNRLFLGSREEFVGSVKAFQKNWEQAQAESLELYKAVIDRMVASEQEKERKKQEAILKRKQEDEKLRQLFREKNFIQ